MQHKHGYVDGLAHAIQKDRERITAFWVDVVGTTTNWTPPYSQIVENFGNVFGDFFRVYQRTEVGRLQSDLAATSAPTIKKQVESRLQCARRMQNIFGLLEESYDLLASRLRMVRLFLAPNLFNRT